MNRSNSFTYNIHDSNPQNLTKEHEKESYGKNFLIAIRNQEEALLFLSL